MIGGMETAIGPSTKSVEEVDTVFHRLGYSQWRPHQRRAVQGILEGRDTLLILPTGGGKSVVFQVPALILPGLTVVVSPLIALMKDQVNALQAKGVPATFLNSSLKVEEIKKRTVALLEDRYKILYVAPERFASSAFREQIASMNISLLVVDECHCISSWGHDFRPDYRNIKEVRKLLGWPTVVAVTATATPEVRQDIVTNLGMEDPVKIVAGFARPNLDLRCGKFPNAEAKAAAFETLVGNLLRGQTKIPSTIVYCTSRQSCEDVSRELNERFGAGLSLPYHAELKSSTRTAAQEQFLSGKVPWIVATIAFGMGIDKADVRYVIHHTIPGSPEAYYQEVGRAGRDGLPSICYMLYSNHDVNVRRYFIESVSPTQAIGKHVYAALLSAVPPGSTKKITYAQIIRSAGSCIAPGDAIKASTALTLLKRAGAFWAPAWGHVATPPRPPSYYSLPVDWHEVWERRRRDLARLAKVQEMVCAENKQQYLLRYFGEIE
jgi:ATP-dependent DNA helicase RecQ